MKKFLCLLFVLIIIASLVFPLFGCKHRDKNICTDINDKLLNILIIYKESNIMLSNIIDLNYDKATNEIQYKRVTLTGRNVIGVVPYDKVYITVANGYLYYKNDNWYYKDKDTGVSCLISKDEYYNKLGGMK